MLVRRVEMFTQSHGRILSCALVYTNFLQSQRKLIIQGQDFTCSDDSELRGPIDLSDLKILGLLGCLIPFRVIMLE